MKFINFPKINCLSNSINIYFYEENNLQKPYKYSIKILNKENKFYLICAAVYFEEGDHCVLGKRHSDCLQYRNKLFEGIYNKRICENDINTFGGFLAYNPIQNINKFVSRKEGLSILTENNQILRTIPKHMLFSEDLY